MIKASRRFFAIKNLLRLKVQLHHRKDLKSLTTQHKHPNPHMLVLLKSKPQHALLESLSDLFLSKICEHQSMTSAFDFKMLCKQSLSSVPLAQQEKKSKEKELFKLMRLMLETIVSTTLRTQTTGGIFCSLGAKVFKTQRSSTLSLSPLLLMLLKI